MVSSKAEGEQMWESHRAPHSPNGVLAQEAGDNYTQEWSEKWHFGQQNWDREDKRNGKESLKDYNTRH